MFAKVRRFFLLHNIVAAAHFLLLPTIDDFIRRMLRYQVRL